MIENIETGGKKNYINYEWFFILKIYNFHKW
jgi:hypothetical protein